jgi:hypothetical protein
LDFITCRFSLFTDTMNIVTAFPDCLKELSVYCEKDYC